VQAGGGGGAGCCGEWHRSSLEMVGLVGLVR
jgi:hypothetical protein